MQTDPNDVIKALNLIENYSSRDKLFIKGKEKEDHGVMNFLQ